MEKASLLQGFLDALFPKHDFSPVKTLLCYGERVVSHKCMLTAIDQGQNE